MEAYEEVLAKAAASLTVADFHWLKEHGDIQEAASSSEKALSSQPTHAREQSSQGRHTAGERKRRQVQHEWPEVGTILEADYHGQHYEAEVIPTPAFRAGRAVKILDGPAAGLICRSLSGAMIAATEKQRQEQSLGKKGVVNGWRFWKTKGAQ